jgi:hypothetical protein
MKKDLPKFVYALFDLIANNWSLQRYNSKTDRNVVEDIWWMWENVAIDFVLGLPKSMLGSDSIWVIIDRLTNSMHSVHIHWIS